jgi:hypothetical protein
MGLFNWAQIKNLSSELFQNCKATQHLFEVVQDFYQNFVGLQNSFYKLRGMLFQLILANPTLLDARLSRIENQLRDRLRCITHAIQAAIHQRFAINYLNPAEMAELFRNLEERAAEASCELLVQYHSDLFQIETSLLYDGQDGHILIHIPMTPKNSLLRLFRLNPFPLPLFETHHLLPEREKRSMTKVKMEVTVTQNLVASENHFKSAFKNSESIYFILVLFPCMCFSFSIFSFDVHEFPVNLFV